METMKRIGEILIEQGSISPHQLEFALDKQKKDTGKLLGRILIEMGYITEDDIVAALAAQLNVPYLPVRNFILDEAVSKMISRELVHKYQFVPLDKTGTLLTIVIADPTDEQAVREIEAATRCKVQCFVGTSTEIAEAIRQHFGAPTGAPIHGGPASAENTPRNQNGAIPKTKVSTNP